MVEFFGRTASTRIMLCCGVVDRDHLCQHNTQVSQTQLTSKFLPANIVKFLRALGSRSLDECVATYSGRLAVARVYIRQWQWQHSCSADMVFILGTWYLYLDVLRLHCWGLGMQLAYSSIFSCPT